MGLVADEQLVVVRNRGLQLVGLDPFKKGKLLSIKKYYSGFSNVSGSIAGSGWSIIKNGEMLYVVDFNPERTDEPVAPLDGQPSSSRTP